MQTLTCLCMIHLEALREALQASPSNDPATVSLRAEVAQAIEDEEYDLRIAAQEDLED
jgi:hypothetical protein